MPKVEIEAQRCRLESLDPNLDFRFGSLAAVACSLAYCRGLGAKSQRTVIKRKGGWGLLAPADQQLGGLLEHSLPFAPVFSLNNHDDPCTAWRISVRLR